MRRVFATLLERDETAMTLAMWVRLSLAALHRAGIAMIVAGCAMVPKPEAPAFPLPLPPPSPAPSITYTHGASSERTPQYFRCVSQAALPMARAPASPAVIARHAAARCEPMRQAIMQALEAENEGKPLAQHYAATFGEALKERVIYHVTGLVREARQK